MEKDSDLTITCCQCSKEFIFTIAEQEFYELKGFATPRRCKECRSARQAQLQPKPAIPVSPVSLVCSTCGNKLEEKTPVVCTNCLDNVKLEFEMKIRGLNSTLNEASAKLIAAELEKAQLIAEAESRASTTDAEKVQWTEGLQAQLNQAESEKVRLAESLQKKGEEVIRLQEQLGRVNLEREKALKYHAAIDSVEPILKSIRERLEVLERNQNSLNQTMQRLVQANEETQNISFMEGLRRLFRPRHESPESRPVKIQ